MRGKSRVKSTLYQMPPGVPIPITIAVHRPSISSENTLISMCINWSITFEQTNSLNTPYISYFHHERNCTSNEVNKFRCESKSNSFNARKKLNTKARSEWLVKDEKWKTENERTKEERKKERNRRDTGSIEEKEVMKYGAAAVRKPQWARCSARSPDRGAIRKKGEPCWQLVTF